MNKTFKIGEVSKIKCIDSQTLRYYDKLGILIPAIIDKDTGYRYYTIEQFIDVDRIKFCKRIGLTLEETKNFMEGKSLSGALDVLKQKKQAFADELERIGSIHDDLGNIVESIENSLLIINAYGFDEVKVKDNIELFGIKGSPAGHKDHFEFEKELANLNKRHPKFAEVGHNFGLATEFNFEEFVPNGPSTPGAIILRVDERFKNDEEVDKIQLGKCVVGYHRGRRYGRLLNEAIYNYVQSNNYVTKGKIYVVPIANRFILDDDSEYIYEVFIPVE